MRPLAQLLAVAGAVAAASFSNCELPGGPAYTEGTSDWSFSLRPLGVVRAVMIFVDFSDALAPSDGDTDA